MPRKCIFNGCTKCAVFNYPEETSRIYCSSHALLGMISIGQKRCKNCGKSAIFGPPGGEMEYCKEHSKINHINLKKPKCQEKNCNLQAYFNYPGIKKGVFCNTHKKEGMINTGVQEKSKCLKCDKIASFNYEGERAKFCKLHKEPNMLNVRSKKCLECNKQPSFNYPGTSELLYCDEHKKCNMVNLRSYKCKFPGCDKTASYGNEKDGIKVTCKEHRSPEMIYLSSNIDNKCHEDDCEIVASYNYIGEKKGIFCNAHKKYGMVHLKTKKCAEKDCIKLALYGFEKDKIKLYCKDHKKLNTIKLQVTKKCEICLIHNAIYGHAGSHITVCRTCKKVGMILKPAKKCIYKNCKKLALYGIITQTHCEEHRREEEINLVERKCKGCELINILDHEGFCKYCNPTNFKSIRLAKQKEVQKMLDDNHYNYFSTDCIIDCGFCGKERPDFVFETPGYFLVLEVDEHQHTSYKCENDRMINISQSLGMQTIFVRYNPDEYTTDNIRENPSKMIRFKKLREILDKFLKLDQEEAKEWGFLSCIYLFYNGYNNTIDKNVIMEYDD